MLLSSWLLLCYVSIPHRYAKNAADREEMLQPSGVSIPHRYAKNTRSRYFSGRAPLFQFLIGTLKTEYEKSVYKGFVRFQFLIGTLKTGEEGSTKLGAVGVSIPHRYAKNYPF